MWIERALLVGYVSVFLFVAFHLGSWGTVLHIDGVRLVFLFFFGLPFSQLVL